MTRSFLFEICDLHLSYLGCNSPNAFATVDTVSLTLHVLTAAAYFGFIAIRILRKGGKKTAAKELDRVAFFAGLAVLFRVGYLAMTRSVQALNIANTSDAEAQNLVRSIVMVEAFNIIMASLSLSIIIDTLVKLATGANLVQSIRIGQKTVNVSQTITVLQLLIFVLTIAFACLLGILGVNGTREQFIIYRRLFYGFPAALSVVVAMPLTMKFGSKVIRALMTQVPGQGVSEYNSVAMSEIKGASEVPEGKQISSNASSPDQKMSKAIASLRMTFNGVMIMYIYNSIYFTSVLFVNEIYTDNHSVLLVTKIVLDMFIWIYATWLLFILYPKLFQSGQ
ncbi:hypothetical protein EDD86DRAFT_271316 [Gorgonomyces haynaldii]|nr:hypothetical protein EDD86DRAFT_271316 [Gorgonomyces haynaldii]